MEYENSKFNERIEKTYLSHFSERRYKLFQFLEEIYKKFINNKDSRIEFIIDCISQVRPQKILEIGSGVLPIYQFLPESIKKTCKYYICEINKEKVRHLINKYSNSKNPLEIICTSALLLPFQDNYFDFILSKGVLHHIDDSNFEKRMGKKMNFLKESKRVLNENGINLLMDFFPLNEFKDLLWHKIYKIVLFEGDYNYLSTSEVQKLFEQASYKDIVSRDLDTYKGLYYCVIGKK